MDSKIQGLAQVEAEEVYRDILEDADADADADAYRCDEPLDCIGCGLCNPRVED